MTQWNLIVDVALCENCNNCILATKDEYVGNNFPGYSAPQSLHGKSVIDITRHVRGSGHMVDVTYVPRMCNHCDDAPCVKAGQGAVTKRPDGIVIVDPVAAKGREDLVAACPYGAIVWNEEQGVPQNWTFDAHLLDGGWKEPRASHSCPTGVFKIVKAEAAEMLSRAAAEGLQVLKPELGTKPRVYYKNLDRVTSHFVAGAVVGEVKGRTECVEGAEVALSLDGQEIARAKTDAFGDFKFDKLGHGSGRYVIAARHAHFGAANAAASAGATTFVGELRLAK